ncbi:MAG: hypothetical protein JWO36_3811 [Myxococcales bacterium]|nr:hypothetical protein [Myxococcales bacterium]
MRVGIVLALTACNAAFGLRETEQRDAQLFDAPADAPFQCPQLGAAPAYSSLLHQVFLQPCYQYSTAMGRASAICQQGSLFVVSEGPVDMHLAPAIGVQAPTLEEQYDQPRLSPDANELYIRRFNYSTNVEDVLMFARSGTGWQRGADPQLQTGMNDALGTLARGPTGDRVIIGSFSDGLGHEWAHEGSTWREVRQHVFAMRPPLMFALTSDGLRAAVYSGLDGVFYADRPDEDSPFRDLGLLIGAPPHSETAMTDDCARIYIGGVGAVFYVQQR